MDNRSYSIISRQLIKQFGLDALDTQGLKSISPVLTLLVFLLHLFELREFYCTTMILSYHFFMKKEKMIVSVS